MILSHRETENAKNVTDKTEETGNDKLPNTRLVGYERCRYGVGSESSVGSSEKHRENIRKVQERNKKMSQDKAIFEYEQSGNVLIVVANGPFMEYRDNDIRNAYNEAYRRLSEPDVRHLLVDFTKLDYFGSTFVGILIRLAKKARSNKGEAVLCHLSDNMKDMLKTLMMLENPKTDFYWVPYPHREAALEALAKNTGEA